MNSIQQIEQLQKEKKELEIKLSGIKLDDSDVATLDDQIIKIDSILDKILSINATIDKNMHPPKSMYTPEAISRLMKRRVY